jgi:predicted secreted hydrolase
LKAEGLIKAAGINHKVSGTAWMDHEFASSILKQDRAGWDWFSIQLDDNTELMVFHMRKKDGTSERRFGTFVQTDGRTVNLANKRIVITPHETWTSPRTKAVYPSRWSISIPDLEMDLEVIPVMKDQEISSAKSTGIVYWEGAVNVKGTRDGRKVQGKGYVELTGYAHSMAGRL